MIQPFKTSVRRMRIIMCKCARENLPARDESPTVRDKSAALELDEKLHLRVKIV